jgi:hypothetical protein
MINRSIIFGVCILFSLFVSGQNTNPNTCHFKSKNGLFTYINKEFKSIGKLTGSLVQRDFDAGLFKMEYDSSYVLSIDSAFKENGHFVILMTLYKFEKDPFTVSWFRNYIVLANWTRTDKGKILHFYDYGYEF